MLFVIAVASLHRKRCYDPYLAYYLLVSHQVISFFLTSTYGRYMSFQAFLDTLGPEIEDPEEGSYSFKRPAVNVQFN
jgi:hypothetical protein